MPILVATSQTMFFFTLTRLAVFGRFPRQNWNIKDSEFWSKTPKNMFFQILPILILVNLPGATKAPFFTEFPKQLSLYRMSKKGGMFLVIFRRFLNFRLFFGPFLGRVVEDAIHKKIASGNPVNSIFSKLNCKLYYGRLF